MKFFNCRSNSLRLWMPQLFAMIESYKSTFMKNDNHVSGLQSSFCYMLEKSSLNSTRYVNETISNDPVACVPVSYLSDVNKLRSQFMGSEFEK